VALRRLTNLLLGSDAELKTSTTHASVEVPYSFTAIGHNCDPAGIEHLVSTDQRDGHQWGRDGNLISLQYLLVRGTVSVPYSWDCTVFRYEPVAVTVCLCLDTQTNGVQADSGLVFGNYMGNDVGNASIQRAISNRDRFRVFRQQVFHLSQAITMNDVNIPSYGGCSQSFEWFIPLDGLQMMYKGAGDAVADVVDNSFHISAFSTVAPYHILSNPIRGPVFSYSCSARYFSGPA